MVAITASVECVEYRIVLLRADSQGVLAIDRENESRLLRVSLPANVRPTSHLQRILQSNWGIHGLILDYLPSRSNSTRCVVVELLSDDSPALELRTFHLDDIAEVDLSESERAAVFGMLAGSPRSIFSRPGWIDDAIAWIESATGQRVSSKRKIDQYNSWGLFTLIRFPMKSGESFWLKATGTPNTHELHVTTLLANISPGHVPIVIAVNPAWNAWIMPDAGATMSAYRTDSPLRFDLLKQAVIAMAEVQLQTAGRETELLTGGAFDQSAAALSDNAGLMFERIGEAMSLQTSTRVPRIGKERLVELHDIFVTTCSAMEDLSIPTMVVHGDTNADNILNQSGRCTFIDWCEIYVGIPFITLQHLLLLNQATDPSVKNSSDRVLTNCYREVMKSVCYESAIDRAIACMPMLAAASAIYGRGDWLQSSLSDNPHRQAYMRMLAREMDRAAKSVALLEAVAYPTSTR